MAFTAGQKVRAADLNGIATFPVAQMFSNTVQSLPNNTWTSLLLDSESFDTHNGHSTTSLTSRWVVPAGWGGYYQVRTGLYLDGTGGDGLLRLARNGLAIRGATVRQTLTTTYSGMQSSIIVLLAPGEYVEGQVNQTTTGPRATYVATDYTTFMDVTFLRAV